MGMGVGNGKGSGNCPPVDDVCPVCHGDFNLPCRTSCSHWFCGECILRVWLHGDAMKRCKCPMCCCLFTTLAPFQPAFDSDSTHKYNHPHPHPHPHAKQIMHQVTRYNRLHVGGIPGLFQKILDLPFFVRIALRDMMDPDKASSNLYKARIFALLLGMTYVLIPLDFLPYGNKDILNLFDFCAVAFVTIMYIIALCRARRRTHR